MNTSDIESPMKETRGMLEGRMATARTSVGGSSHKSDYEEMLSTLRTIFGVEKTEEAHAIFVSKMRERLDMAGMSLPTVEVRYRNLSVTVNTHCGKRALPTLRNSVLDALEDGLAFCGVPVAKKQKFSVLSEVSGIIKPGRLTLLLGPPGGGKTTLLLSLAGQLDPSLEVRGEVTYNGQPLHEFVPRKTAAYISQQDVLAGELTVRETLLYSARSQGIGPYCDLLRELMDREEELGICPNPVVDAYMKMAASPHLAADLATEYTLKILGLESCADTVVGDFLRPGISGGEKKRVTTGEMIVGPIKTFFMDEITNGLDSSTAQQIVTCLRNVCHSLEYTVVMSLLQPSPEIFDLFDDVILLADGQILFHGEKEEVLPFFGNCGFKSPERKAVADFLQEVTSEKDQQQYWSNKRKQYQYVPVSKISETFRNKFHGGTTMERELREPFNKDSAHKMALSLNNYSVSYKDLWKINLWKEWLFMRRTFSVYIARVLKIIIVAFIASTLYFRMDRDNLLDARLFGSAIFYGIYTMLLSGYSEVVLTIHRLPVVYKHRDLLFLPTWAFTVSKALLGIPVSFVESVVWTSITYYITGFSSDPERFLQQLFLYFCIHLMATSLFPLVAGICRTMPVSATAGTVTLVIFFACGGFLIVRTSINVWCIWAYWASPLSYAQNGISAIEFLSPEWNKSTDRGPVTLGIQYMNVAGLFPKFGWYWIAVGVMLGYTVVFHILFTKVVTCLKSFGTTHGGRSTDSVSESGILKRKKPLSQPLSLKSGFKSDEVTSQQDDEEYSTTVPDMCESHPVQISSETSTKSFNRVQNNVKKGMILPFKPLALSFRNICYSIKIPAEMRRTGTSGEKLQLLDGVTGAFRPGVLTALVGVSGAGKTTLMDVLAGRKTGGCVEGQIFTAGFPKSQSTYARVSGYCEQNDIHSPQLTVYESLSFSARLRLPSDVSTNVKKVHVEEIVNLVELRQICNALIGLPGVSGLSLEQRKRVTIAVELTANPSIIFMDEPTTGLDSRAAAIVMRTVRNTVDTGRTVVCTIHQPSIDVFESFDELLFLKVGGRVIHAGPIGAKSQKIVQYFENIPGVPPLPQGRNPATWMLNVTNRASEIRLGIDFADLYQISIASSDNEQLVNEVSKPMRDAKDIVFPTTYATSYFTQTMSILWKLNITYWRMPSYNNSRFFFTVATGLIFGMIFWGQGGERYVDNSVYSVISAIYASTLFLGIINASTVQAVVSTERKVYYRERAAATYSPVPYGISQVLMEIPYCALQSVIYSLISYWMIGLEVTFVKFFSYLYFYFFTYLNFTFYGMLAVAVTPNEQLAFILATMLYGFFNLFSGFLIPKPRIPGWWLWAFWSCPMTYSIYGLVTSQFGDEHHLVQMKDGSQMELAKFIETIWGYKTDNLRLVSGATALFGLAFAILFVVSLKLFNFQNR